MKKKLFVLFLLFTFVLTSAFGCKNASQAPATATKTVTITYWRVFDDQDAFADIMSSYQKLHPNVNFEYKKFRYDEYEKELLNALAEDRGPDIFSIPSSWLREYKPKISPMPDTVSLVYSTTKGSIKKEVVQELRTTKTLSLRDLKSNFVDIVNNDVVLNDENGKARIFGLPLYLDTMAMFYNRDLFNNAGIAQAPQYWNEEFQQDVKKLTKVDNKGTIIQSGVSLGGSTNINRSADILSLLMMQNGADMMRDSSVAFHTLPEGYQSDYNPGMEALRFYTDFSNPGKEVHCWDNSMDNSLVLFSSGKLAMTFGYSYDLPTIKSQGPKLNFSVAPMPQIKGKAQINYANYWVETVSNKSKNKDIAWDFIQYATSLDNVKSYLKVAKRPTALSNNDLIKEESDDLDIGVFAQQTLTAKSWYKGKDTLAEEKTFGDMIDLAVKGTMSLSDIITQGAAKVQQTID